MIKLKVCHRVLTYNVKAMPSSLPCNLEILDREPDYYLGMPVWNVKKTDQRLDIYSAVSPF